MENVQKLANAMLTNIAYRTPINQMETIPSVVTVGSDAVDVSEHRKHLLELFSQKQYGVNVELTALFLHQHYELLPLSKAEYSALAKYSAGEASTTSHFTADPIAPLYNYVRSHRSEGESYIIAGKLHTPSAVKKREIVAAASVAFGKHPLREYLISITNKYKSTNAIDMLPPEDLLSLIDFPFTSIENLLRCIPSIYIDSTMYTSRGILVGTLQEFIVVYAEADPAFYKVMELDTFRKLFYKDIFSTKMTKRAAGECGILELKNGGSSRA